MSQEFTLKSNEFRRERFKSWRELEKLIQRCEGAGLGSLSGAELSRLPVLYRAALSSLSVARSISLDRALLDYLEALVARAYFVVYRPKENALTAFVNFFRVTFPRAVRKAKKPFALALTILVLGALTGFFMTLDDPVNFYIFVDGELAGGRGPESTAEELRVFLYGKEDPHGGQLAFFAAFLFRNNASIGLLAFALGGLAGIPVFLLIFNNGLMLGAFAAVHHDKGLSPDLWGWLLIHGVTELLAIVLCGAAGLAIAKGMLFPGQFSRLDSLKIEGRNAGVIALGSVLLFIFAGILEGFFRQLVQGIELRYTIAALSAVFWLWYFIRCGRGHTS
ncbi:MAG: putative membrane protein SpoIIM required for sporulation [Planctomycetota bacterium]|jgi:uncharacterized membrane protein SpoIIM required for sporulation